MFIKKVLVLSSTIILIAIIFTFSRKQKLIERISYVNSSFGYVYLASELDFTKGIGKYYSLSSDPEYHTFEEIDTEAFNTVKLKNAKKIQEKLHKTGIAHWKDDYVNPNIFDGYQWSVTIYYEDGTEKNTHGSNDKPFQFDEFEKIIVSDF